MKQLVTMEVIQWTTLWDSYKNEFENENNVGKNLGDKAAEDLRERVIEHVIPSHCYISFVPSLPPNCLGGILWISYFSVFQNFLI